MGDSRQRLVLQHVPGDATAINGDELRWMELHASIYDVPDSLAPDDADAATRAGEDAAAPIEGDGLRALVEHVERHDGEELPEAWARWCFRALSYSREGIERLARGALETDNVRDDHAVELLAAATESHFRKPAAALASNGFSIDDFGTKTRTTAPRADGLQIPKGTPIVKARLFQIPTRGDFPDRVLGVAVRMPVVSGVVLSLWHGLVRAEWERHRHAEERTPAIHAVVTRLLAASYAPSIITAQPRTDGGVSFDDEAGIHRGDLPRSASVILPHEGLVLGAEANPVAGPLLLHCILTYWRQWAAGNRTPELVEIPASRDELRKITGMPKHLKVSDVEAALRQWTTLSVHVESGTPHPLISTFTRQHGTPGPKGGRGKESFMVTCGVLLNARRLHESYSDHNVQLPTELRFYSPVFDPKRVPVTGYLKTRRHQRAALALGAGEFLALKRDTYSRDGGINVREPEIIDEWCDYSARRFHLYERGKLTSLARSVWEVAQTGSTPRRGAKGAGAGFLPGMPGAPLLVPVEPGSDLHRLADDAAHAMIVKHGETSRRARARQGRKGKGGNDGNADGS